MMSQDAASGGTAAIFIYVYAFVASHMTSGAMFVSIDMTSNDDLPPQSIP